MSNLRIFEYQGSPIQFEEVNGRLMANATLMAQAFNKRPDDIFRTKSWQEFENEILDDLRLRVEDIRTVKYGDSGGSWIHQELVIEFARRLKPSFAIWCNRKIAELLRTGKVELSIPQTLPEALRAYAAVIEDKQKVEAKLLEIAPKAEYYDNVLNSTDLLTTTEVGQHIGLAAIKLNRILYEMGVQRKVNNTWTLTSRYVGEGLGDLKTHSFRDGEGNLRSSQHLYWTQKGRQFIYNKVNGII